MKLIFHTNQFKRGLRLARRRGKDIEKLKEIMRLIECGHLQQKHHDHPLRGDYAHYRECHVEPDWLLIYRVTETLIIFADTGAHSDLFD